MWHYLFAFDANVQIVLSSTRSLEMLTSTHFIYYHDDRFNGNCISCHTQQCHLWPSPLDSRLVLTFSSWSVLARFLPICLLIALTASNIFAILGHCSPTCCFVHMVHSIFDSGAFLCENLHLSPYLHSPSLPSSGRVYVSPTHLVCASYPLCFCGRAPFSPLSVSEAWGMHVSNACHCCSGGNV